jgi:hypothetical protein
MGIRQRVALSDILHCSNCARHPRPGVYSRKEKETRRVEEKEYERSDPSRRQPAVKAARGLEADEANGKQSNM